MGATCGEWWFDGSGQNLLAGVAEDPANLPCLTDATIIDLLRQVPASRDSFNRLVPNMLPAEQVRLRAIAAGYASLLKTDDVVASDNFQKRLNTAHIHTCGPAGGGSWAPNRSTQ